MAEAQTFKNSLKAIQLPYQIFCSTITPLKKILFPKILGSQGAWIPLSQNRVEVGFAAMALRVFPTKISRAQLPRSWNTGADAAFDCQKLAYFNIKTKHGITCATPAVIFSLRKI